MTGTTHADSLALPTEMSAHPSRFPLAARVLRLTNLRSHYSKTKAQFYEHVTDVLKHLLAPSSPPDDTSNLITTGANAASLLFGSFENFEALWGREPGRRVNWAGV